MVSAWAGENWMVLGQTKVNEKSNEITAIPQLLNLLDISGCVVTLDALGTQTRIAQHILDARADYILPVKNNQGTLYEDMTLLFEGFESDEYTDVIYDMAKQTTEGHNRREIRQLGRTHEAQVYFCHATDFVALSGHSSLIPSTKSFKLRVLRAYRAAMRYLAGSK